MIDLFPGVFMTVKMTPDSVGRWLLHCHVNDHMVHGMEALYDVAGCVEVQPDFHLFLHVSNELTLSRLDSSLNGFS